uniref:Uncharacterized protein n=1 Tax=Arundo donax TaxID=35708 RepID=A0A0A9H5E9_ARUDO
MVLTVISLSLSMTTEYQIFYQFKLHRRR